MVLLADADSLSSSSGDDARTRADLLGHCDVIFIAPAPSRPPWHLTTARGDEDDDEDGGARPRASASAGRLVHAAADIGIVVIAVSSGPSRSDDVAGRSAPLFLYIFSKLFFEPRV
tara:strand:- start:55 stop:402 length:348 start_codon:yes stop_codon:yes gene_type:complete